MKELNARKRIEYIDAMRGFTMFLVVLGHCAFFMLPPIDSVYLDMFQSFRMPLFFFVSGFVFYKAARVWNMATIREFFAKKIFVQIISPLLFFFLYLYTFDQPLLESLFDEQKQGYWFTFALFEYFIMYILSCKLSDIFHFSSKGHDILLLVISILIITLLNHHITSRLPQAFNLFGVVHLNYFIYFVFGTLVRKYFVKFEKILDDSSLMLFTIVIFVLLNVFREHLMIPGVNLLTRLILGITGIIIVFAFFRVYQDKFVGENRLGKVMQFVGRRTLDIYLLHYFVLPWGITRIPEFLTNTPLMSLFTASVIAILVICVCLLISSVLRLHPLLAHYLFGAKKYK